MSQEDSLVDKILEYIEYLKDEISEVSRINGCDDKQMIEDTMTFYINEIERNIKKLKLKLKES